VRFRAVFFDVGETLVHPSPSFPELFAAVLARAGHMREPEAVIEASRTVFLRFSEASRDRELWTTSPERSERFWKDVYGRMLWSLSVPAGDGLPDRLYRTFTDPASYALFEDVVPALDALAAAEVGTGIVSNFEAWLEDLLDRLAIRDRFPVRAISGIEGVEKPDPRLFELALTRAGVAAGDAAYVGDNPEFDVHPAREIGMTPVLIDRRGRFPDEDVPTIADLRDLAAVLEVLL
jgi:putative hydrolase of the HAD superfamily